MITSKEKTDSRKLPMMPIRDVVIFPHMMTPFVVGRESSVRALEEALAGDRKIFLATQHDAKVDEPRPDEIFSTGTIANIVQSLRQSDGNIKVLVEGVERAKLVKNGSTSYVEIDDGFDRAWRRVGLALDRSGFTVEERDKAGGRYVVRYVDPDQDKDGPGFFAKLFGSAKDVKPVQYRVFVRPQGSTVQVSVQPVQAPADKLPDASPRILQLLHDELK